MVTNDIFRQSSDNAYWPIVGNIDLDPNLKVGVTELDFQKVRKIPLNKDKFKLEKKNLED